jgi:hypothetical protein
MNILIFVSTAAAAAIREGLLGIHDSRGSGEEGEAKGHQHQYPYDNIPPCQQPPPLHSAIA